MGHGGQQIEPLPTDGPDVMSGKRRLTSPAAQMLAQCLALDKPVQGVSQAWDVIRLDAEAPLSVAEKLGQAADAGRDHRLAGCHGFQDGVA